MKYKMLLSYDGTNYGGWQVQPHRKTIQEVIQNALKTLLQYDSPLTGSGRTDAGVHALEQVAHFCTDISFEISPFISSLNTLLPHDIRIHEILPVPESFHARYDVKRKIYHYHLSTSRVQNPFNYRYRTAAPPSFDLILLQESLSHFLGTHNFTSFKGAGCGSKDPIKTLYRLEVVPEEGGIRLEFEGNGFLYKMVRNIMGTLLEIATNKRPPSEIPKLLSIKDRTQAGPTASPQGLFLVKVIY